MIIKKINESDKKLISLWQYEEEHSGFNYALRENGWTDCYCAHDDTNCYVAKIDENIIGMFLFIPHKSNEFRILINPEYLSKGYGKVITNKALEIGFCELEFEHISLIVRQNHTLAIKLYEKMGFIRDGETKEIVNNQEMDFYTMKKENK